MASISFDTLDVMNKVFEDLSTSIYENDEGFLYVCFRENTVLDLLTIHQSLAFLESCAKQQLCSIVVDLSNVLSISYELKYKFLMKNWMSRFAHLAFLHMTKSNYFILNLFLKLPFFRASFANVKVFRSLKKAESWLRDEIYERVDNDHLMPDTKVYEGSHSRTFQRFDGILFSEALSGFCGLETTSEQLKFMQKFYGLKKQRLPFLLDIRRVKSRMTFGARQLYFGHEFQKYSGNIAILVHSTFSKILISSLIKHRPDERFFKVFTQKKEAVAWLKKTYASCYVEGSCKLEKCCGRVLNPKYQLFDREVGEDGILYYRFERDCVILEQDIEELLEESLHESMGEKVDALLDMRSVVSMSNRAKRMFLGSFSTALFRRLAILCSSNFEILLWRFSLMFMKREFPLAFFRSKQDALRWILELKKDEKFPICEMNFSVKTKELLLVIAAFTRRDFSQKLKVAKSNHPFNQLAHGINFLGKELEEQDKEIKSKHSRLIQAEKLASLGELSSSLGHELNNPLCIAMGFSDILEKKVKDSKTSREDLGEFVRSIADSLLRMHKIIKHMKEYSRRPKEKFEVLRVNDVIEKSLILISEQLKLSSIQVFTSLCDTNPKVMGDENRLEQVFVNLISNAKDSFCETSIHERKTISISSSADSQYLQIRFEDNGAGIPKNIIGRVFDPFFTSKDVGKGTGLGLSISHEIIKEHQGEISCRSIQGEGSVFLIKIPLHCEQVDQFDESSCYR